MRLVEVDYDPFETETKSQPRLTPVDYNPFEDESQDDALIASFSEDSRGLAASNDAMRSWEVGGAEGVSNTVKSGGSNMMLVGDLMRKAGEVLAERNEKANDIAFDRSGQSQSHYDHMQQAGYAVPEQQRYQKPTKPAPIGKSIDDYLKSGGKQLSELGQKVWEYGNGVSEYLETEYPHDDIVKNPAALLKPGYWARELTAQGMYYGPQVLAAMLGGAGVANAVGILNEGGGAYAELKNSGDMPEDEAILRGIGTLAAFAAVNKIPFDHLVGKSAKTKRQRILKSLSQGGIAAVDEWLEEVGETVAAEAGNEGFWDKLAESAVQGINVIPSSFVMGAGSGMTSGSRKAQYDATMAKRNATLDARDQRDQQVAQAKDDHMAKVSEQLTSMGLPDYVHQKVMLAVQNGNTDEANQLLNDYVSNVGRKTGLAMAGSRPGKIGTDESPLAQWNAEEQSKADQIQGQQLEQAGQQQLVGQEAYPTTDELAARFESENPQEWREYLRAARGNAQQAATMLQRDRATLDTSNALSMYALSKGWTGAEAVEFAEMNKNNAVMIRDAKAHMESMSPEDVETNDILIQGTRKAMANQARQQEEAKHVAQALARMMMEGQAAEEQANEQNVPDEVANDEKGNSVQGGLAAVSADPVQLQGVPADADSVQGAEAGRESGVQDAVALYKEAYTKLLDFDIDAKLDPAHFGLTKEQAEMAEIEIEAIGDSDLEPEYEGADIPGSGGDIVEDASIQEQLAIAYESYIGKNNRFIDKQSAVDNMRGALESRYDFKQEVTDTQIISAAKDEYESRMDRIARIKNKSTQTPVFSAKEKQTEAQPTTPTNKDGNLEDGKEPTFPTNDDVQDVPEAVTGKKEVVEGGKVDTIVGAVTLQEFEREQDPYQPWEVTQQDWINLQKAERRRIGQNEESGTKFAPYSDYEEFHKAEVKEAISRGDDIDERVLADYPELQKQAENKKFQPLEKVPTIGKSEETEEKPAAKSNRIAKLQEAGYTAITISASGKTAKFTNKETGESKSVRVPSVVAEAKRMKRAQDEKAIEEADAKDAEALAGVEARDESASIVPKGWSESSKGGLMTNPDQATGGIIDKEAVSGEWFVVPNDDDIGNLTGYATRNEAYEALQKAVEGNRGGTKEAVEITVKPQGAKNKLHGKRLDLPYGAIAVEVEQKDGSVMVYEHFTGQYLGTYGRSTSNITREDIVEEYGNKVDRIGVENFKKSYAEMRAGRSVDVYKKRKASTGLKTKKLSNGITVSYEKTKTGYHIYDETGTYTVFNRKGLLADALKAAENLSKDKYDAAIAEKKADAELAAVDDGAVSVIYDGMSTAERLAMLEKVGIQYPKAFSPEYADLDTLYKRVVKRAYLDGDLAQATVEPEANKKEQRKENRESERVEEDAELADLFKKLRGLRSRMTMGLDPDVAIVGTKIAALYIKKGVRNFRDFAASFKDQIGDDWGLFKQQLLAFWQGAAALPENAGHIDKIEDLNRAQAKAILDEIDASSSEQKPADGVLYNKEGGRDESANVNDDGHGNVVDGSGAPGAGRDDQAGDASRQRDESSSELSERPNGKGVGRGVQATGAGAVDNGTERSDEPDSVPAGRPGNRAEAIEQDESAKTETNEGISEAADGRSVQRRTGRNGNSVRGRNGNSVRGRKSRRIEPSKELTPEQKNHHIEDGATLIVGGDKTKATANIAAIKLLKKLEKADRLATPAEKAILAKYVGWGGLPNVFDEYKARSRSWNKAWEKQWGTLYDQVKKVLTDEEWANAAASTLNAHYTSRDIISGMWDIAAQLGFVGGRVGEFGAGIGHFAGLQPLSSADKSKWNMVEMDSITGRMLKKLYPQANVSVGGLEKTKVKSNSLDMVIGNFPFAKDGPYDKNYPSFSLHNYFFARAVDAVKPGGLIVAISSMSTMDAMASREARRWMADRVDLIGAVRLPNNAFKANAGTEVTTDIVVLRKRDKNILIEGQPWTSTREIDTYNGKGKVSVNEYYADHPEMMLGRMSLEGTQYRNDEPALLPNTKGKIKEHLSNVVSKFPRVVENQSNDKSVTEQNDEGAFVGELAAGMKDGAVVIKDGEIYQVEGTEYTQPKWAKQKRRKAAAKSYVNIKEQAIALRGLMLDPEATDKQIKAAQKALGKAYDAHVKKYKALNHKNGLSFLEDDPDHPFVLALEESRKVTKNGIKSVVYEKAAIFNDRVILPNAKPEAAETIQDALQQSVAYKGYLDVNYMAQLLDSDVESVVEELIKENLAYDDPHSGMVVDNNEYLSGNVRKKLREAESAAKQDDKYTRNVEDLKKVIPETIPIDDIGIRLGANWVNPKMIEYFIYDVLGVTTRISYEKNNGRGNWYVEERSDTTDAKNVSTWGAGGITGLEMVKNALNLKSVTAYVNALNKNGELVRVVDKEKTVLAQVKQAELKEHFEKWIKAQEKYREELESAYNEQMNAMVERKYTGADWKWYPGMAHNENMVPRQKQKEAIARNLTESTLDAHAVGTGKTLIQVATAMEMRRLGLANKPMIVVQNATHSQFTREFMQMYPGARILSPSKKQRSAKERNRLMSRISTGDWDAVIIPQSFFNMLPDDPEREKAFINQEIDQLKEALYDAAKAGERRSPRQKDIQRAIRAKQKKLTKLMDRKKDNTIMFEELGVDALLVDEAHAYKKLQFVTKMDNIKGLDKGASQRAFSMYMKSSHILAKRNGKNVILATGTPISNTLAEAWTMVRLIRPDVLEAYGVENFDDFAANFGEAVTNIEQTPGGEWKEVTRFAKYKNVPELSRFFRSAADVVLQDQAGIKGIPKHKGGRPYTVSIKRGKNTERYIQVIRQMLNDFENMSGMDKKNNSHIPMVCYGLGRKATLDLRLIDSGMEIDDNSKIFSAADNIIEKWKESDEHKGTQLVFADIFRSPDKKFNLYEELRSELVKRGMPAEEVGIMSDVKTEAQREALFDKVRSGDVRVIIGSTERMGVGVNIQDRAYAIHHLDAPPRPMDIEQRLGRVFRTGNMFENVYEFRYGVIDTLDSALYQRLSIKDKMIKQVLRGDYSSREIEDAEDSLGFEEQMAIYSGNPLAMEKVGLMSKAIRFNTLLDGYKREQTQLRRQIASTKNEIINGEKRIVEFKEKLRIAEEQEAGAFDLIIDGQRYDKPEDARKAFKEWFEEQKSIGNEKYEGKTIVEEYGNVVFFTFKGLSGHFRTKYFGQNILMNGTAGEYAPNLTEVELEFTHSHQRYSVRSAKLILDAPKDNVITRQMMLSGAISALEEDKKNLPELEANLKRPFDHLDEYRSVVKRLDEIDKELKASAKETAKTDGMLPGLDVKKGKSPLRASIMKRLDAIDKKIEEARSVLTGMDPKKESHKNVSAAVENLELLESRRTSLLKRLSIVDRVRYHATMEQKNFPYGMTPTKTEGIFYNAAGDRMGEKLSSGMAASDVESATSAIAEKFNADVQVFQSVDELPPSIMRIAEAQAEKQGLARDGFSAFTYKGKVYLFANKLQSAEEVQQVMFEELVHSGLNALSSPELDAVLDDVYANRKGLRSMAGRKAVKQVEKDYPGVDVNSEQGHRLVANEIVAHIAQNRATKKTLWRKLVDAVRKAFARMFKGTRFEKILSRSPDSVIEDLIDLSLKVATPSAGSKEISFAATIKKGVKFESIKRSLPKDDMEVIPFDKNGTFREIVQRVEEFLVQEMSVVDPEGRTVLLANTEKGSLKKRAEHLVGSKKAGRRRYHAGKASMITMIPHTISDPIVKVNQGNKVVYFRRYANGKTHMVVTDRNKEVVEQSVYDGGLITQYVPERGQSFKDARVTFCRSPEPAVAGSATLTQAPNDVQTTRGSHNQEGNKQNTPNAEVVKGDSGTIRFHATPSESDAESKPPEGLTPESAEWLMTQLKEAQQKLDKMASRSQTLQNSITKQKAKTRAAKTAGSNAQKEREAANRLKAHEKVTGKAYTKKTNSPLAVQKSVQAITRQEYIAQSRDKSKTIAERSKAAKEYMNAHLKGHPEEKAKLLTSFIALERASLRKPLKGPYKTMMEKRFNNLLEKVNALEKVAERKTAITKLKKIVKKINKFGIGNFSAERKEGIKDTLGDIAIKKLKDDEAVREAIAEMKADGDISEDEHKDIEATLAKRIEDLSTDEIKYITSWLEHAMTDQRQERKSAHAAQKRKAYDDGDAIISSVERAGVDLNGRRAKTGLRKLYRAGFLKTETIANQMDDWNEDGHVSRTFINNFQEGERKNYKVMQTITEYLGKNLPELNEEKMKRKRKADLEHRKKDKRATTYKLESGGEIHLYDGEKITLYLSSLNPDNTRHLLEGGFVYPESREDAKSVKLTEGDLAVIVTDVQSDEKLSEIADVFHDVFNKDSLLKGFINETSYDLDRRELADVENYFPIITSRLHRAFRTVGDEAASDPNDVQQMVRMSVESLRPLKRRLPNAKSAIVLEDVFTAAQRSTRVAGLYYGFAKPIRHLDAVLEVQRADKYGGGTVEGALVKRWGRTWFKALASVGRQQQIVPSRSDFDVAYGNALNLLTRGALAYNIPVMALQRISYLTAMPYMPDRYWAAASVSKPATYEHMGKYSPILWARGRGRISIAVGEISKSHTHSVGEFGMKGIMAQDAVVIGRMWNAIHSWIKSENANKSAEEINEMTARYLEKVIRRTQPSFEAATRSWAQRSTTPTAKGLMRFTSQTTALYDMKYRNHQQAAHKLKQIKISNLKGKAKADAIGKVFGKWFETEAILVLSAMAVAALRAAVGVAYRRKKEDEDMLVYLLKQFGSGYFAMYGQGMALLANLFIGGYTPSDPIIDAVGRTWSTITKTKKLAEDVASQDKYKTTGQKKWEKDIERGIWPTIRNVGTVTGTGLQNALEPAAAALSWLNTDQGFTDYLEGNKPKAARKSKGADLYGGVDVDDLLGYDDMSVNDLFDTFDPTE